ncbi:MAG: polyketide synthase dehydratase domain-containing protein, partial [Gammaproteobacteria bacterium]
AAAPALIVLSAKSADRLEEQARQLLEWVRGRGADAPALSQVAATLQLGRNAMEERLGLLVRSFDELEHKLAAVLAGQRRLEHVYAGRAGKHALSDALLGDEDLDQLVAAWMAHGQHDKLLRLWAGGHSIDWTGLYRDGAPRRVHLPTYPFAGERYWYTPSAPERAVVAAGAGYRLLHPLLHTNTSDLSAQKYSSTFDGAEFFLADHVVHGRPVLPGVAYLEMARAAACNAACAAHVRLTDVVWARPITLDGADVQVQLTLAPTEDAGLRYEVLTGEAGAEPVLHSRGGIELVAAFPDERHDLAACIARCQLRSLSHDDCYRIFDAAGIAYGRGHRIIERLLVGRGEALAELVLPQAMAPTLDDFVLHPGLADAALQACIGLLMDDSADGQGGGQPPLLLPFALRALEVRAPCTQRMWAIVTGERTRNGAGLLEMNIDLCDHEGRICARLTGFSARPYGTQGAPAQLDAAGTVLLAPAWSAAPEPVEPAASSFDRHVVLLCDVWTEVLAAHLPARVQVHRLASATAHPAERFAAHALAAFGIVQDLLKQGVCERVLV